MRVWLAGVLLAALAAGCSGAPAWESFSDPEGLYRVEMFGAPRSRSISESDGTTTQVYESLLENVQYALWETSSFGMEADAALEAYRLNVSEQYANVEILGESRLERDGVPGIEIFFEYDNKRQRVRERLQYYVDGGRTIILLYAAAIDVYSEADAARFLDSLTFGG